MACWHINIAQNGDTKEALDDFNTVGTAVDNFKKMKDSVKKAQAGDNQQSSGSPGGKSTPAAAGAAGTAESSQGKRSPRQTLREKYAAEDKNLGK